MKDKIRYLSQQQSCGAVYDEWARIQIAGTVAANPCRSIYAQTRERVDQFYFSVAAIFETWVTRRRSRHTRRAYREDVMAFIRFRQIQWPEQCAALLSVSITDVQAFRESMMEADAAPKTLNRRISSLSGFYKYLAGAAAGTAAAHHSP